MPLANRIICFGEALWDSVDAGLYLGGAPLNGAFHLRQLGQHPILVSAVGDDWPGRVLRQRLSEAGLDVRGVATHPKLPTSHVRADLSRPNFPRYDIVKPVAWDAIPLPSAATTAGTAAIVFSALALRIAANRVTLAALRARHRDAWQVLDANIRPPHTPLSRIRALAKGVDLLKVNEDELRLLTPGFRGSLEGQVRRLQEKTGARRVVVTLGAQGAGLLQEGKWLRAKGRPVRVASTIGAGDAFLAALLAGLLSGRESARAVLTRACRVAEYVVAHPSATPALPRRLSGRSER